MSEYSKKHNQFNINFDDHVFFCDNFDLNINCCLQALFYISQINTIDNIAIVLCLECANKFRKDYLQNRDVITFERIDYNDQSMLREFQCERIYTDRLRSKIFNADNKYDLDFLIKLSRLQNKLDIQNKD